MLIRTVAYGSVARKPRLSADDWTAAALTALGRGGLSAVAVEPLAAALGATKGSFYWHFADREALVGAALARWEQEETEAVISQLAELDDPRQRLRVLLDLVLTYPEESDLVVALARDAHHPRVAAMLDRVTRRRLDYLVEQFRECGFNARESRRRAGVAYATYVGWWHLRRIVPEAAPQGRAARPYAEILQRLLDL